MTDDAWTEETKGPADDEVAVDYIKATDFRVVWADGVIGNVTPAGLVHFAVYSERLAIPRRQVFKIEAQATEKRVAALGPEIVEKQISRGSVVREMSCDVFLTADVAESLAQWLQARAGEIRKLREEIK